MIVLLGKAFWIFSIVIIDQLADPIPPPPLFLVSSRDNPIVMVSPKFKYVCVSEDIEICCVIILFGFGWSILPCTFMFSNAKS